MTEASLSPDLRQIAEQYLGRPLEALEQDQLLQLQQAIRNQAAPSANAVQQARQQAQRAIAQGQNRAASSVRDLLEAIQSNSSKALQVQDAEEQAILKLLEGSQNLAELRPSTLQSGMGGLQPGSQLALTQIAEHLSNLARQEVEKCFQQSFGPLTQQLQALAERLNAQQAPDGAAGSASPAPAADAVHTPAGTASMP
ncbi:hypothetical protein ACPRNU_02885 [Chromobacterium vaccinii]|uniref:hypothetical protein n=1 Tax=Chromobacterium vaccinii TaxID=1108595 RepID=UPI003C76EE61